MATPEATSVPEPDPATSTRERAAAAVRAGVGSVLGGVTGVVVRVG